MGRRARPRRHLRYFAAMSRDFNARPTARRARAARQGRRKSPPNERFSQVAARPPAASRRPTPDADQATRRFHSVPLKLKMAPSSRNASALCGASASMNCGRNARKKSATLGFSTLVRNPCANTRGSAAGGGAVSTPVRRPRQQQRHSEIDEIRGAHPLDEHERGRRCREDRGEAERRGQRVHDAPRADAERRHRARAPSLRRSPPDDVERVGAGRHVEQQPGDARTARDRGCRSCG